MSDTFPPSPLTPDVKHYRDQRYALVYEGQTLNRIHAGELPIILIPGIPSTERDFRHLAPRINAWAPVVRVIWPGFGVLHHEVDAPSSTIDRAQYLSMIADAEGWSAHFVVGHSLGGVAALAHAALDSRVVGLSLISSVGVRRHRGMVIGSRGARIHLALFKIPIVRSALRELCSRLLIQAGFVGHPFHLGQIELILRHVRDLNFAEQRRLIEMLSQKKSLPIGIVTTEDDPLIDSLASDALVCALREVSPHLAHLRLARGGHNPQRHCIIEIDQWLRARYSEALAWLDLHPLLSQYSEDKPQDSPSLLPEEPL